jgi:hypothetical protein
MASDLSKKCPKIFELIFRQFSMGKYGHLDVATLGSFAQIDADCQKGGI